MDKETATLRGQLAAWKAFGQEALKRLPLDQKDAAAAAIAPGLKRMADPTESSAAALVWAEISRHR